MKTTTPILFGAAALVAMAISFFAGRTSAPVQTVEIPVDGGERTVFIERTSNPLPPRSSENDDASKATDSTRVQVVTEYIERDRVLEFTPSRVDRILSDNDPIARMAALTAMLENLTPENAQMMIERFDNLPQGSERMWEKNLLLYAWGQTDGPAAIEYATQGENRGGRGDWGQQMAASTVLTAWATENPEDAETWAREKTDNADNPYLVGVIRGLARNDLAAATDLTYDLPYGRNRGRAVDSLISGYIQKGPNAAAAWAQNLSNDDERLKAGITTRIISKIASENPRTSVDLAMSLPEGESRQKALEEVADEWSEVAPSRAAEWVDSLDDEKMRSETMAEVAQNWAREDPAQAAEWLNTYEPGPQMDKPYEKFAYGLSRKDPETAIIWANQISEEKRRQDTLGRIVNDWMRRDGPAARAFLGEDAVDGQGG